MRNYSIEAIAVGRSLTRNKFFGLGFDADDTFWQTNKLFGDFKNTYAIRIASLIRGLPYFEFRNNLEHLNRSMHKDVGVRPERWKPIIEKLGSLYPPRARQIFTDPANIDIFAGIYRSAPRLVPGALKAIQTLYQTGLPLFVVTHANADWTHIKFKRSGLRQYFCHIEVVPEDKMRKTEDDWYNGARKAGQFPYFTVAVGDNMEADIQSSYRTGYGLGVWIPSSWGAALGHNNEIPPTTLIAKGIKDVVPKLRNLGILENR